MDEVINGSFAASVSLIDCFWLGYGLFEYSCPKLAFLLNSELFDSLKAWKLLVEAPTGSLGSPLSTLRMFRLVETDTLIFPLEASCPLRAGIDYAD